MIGIVEDTRFREELEKACQRRELKCRVYRSYNAASRGLARRLFCSKLELILIDCSLDPDDWGGTNTEGIRLARKLCQKKWLGHVPIFMYTRFAVAPHTEVKEALESLLDEYGVRDDNDVAVEKRVLNTTLDECMRPLLPSSLLREALRKRNAWLKLWRSQRRS